MLSVQGLTESLSPMAEDRALGSNVADPWRLPSLVFTVITFRFDQIRLGITWGVGWGICVFLLLSKYVSKVIQNFKSQEVLKK